MNSIRGLACAAVILWHALLTIVPADPTASQQLITRPLGLIARESVLLFILLSGFLLGRHWKEGFSRTAIGRKFRTYIIRRTWRIVPPFWAALTLTVLAMLLLGLDKPEGTHWDTGLPLTWERVASNYLMITDLLTQVPLSHQLWTVPLEYHLYLLAPLVVLVRSRALALVLGAAVCLLVVLAVPEDHASYFIFAFVCAFWAGVERQSHRSTRLVDTLHVLWPVVPLSLVLLGVVAAFGDLPASQHNYFLADALVSPVFLVWMYFTDVANRRTLMVRALSWKPLIWVGERSYSHYLVHGVVLECLWRFAVRPLGVDGDTSKVLVMMLAGYFLSLAVGMAMYAAVERPSALKGSRVGARVPRESGKVDKAVTETQ